jgi:hypothetical protein
MESRLLYEDDLTEERDATPEQRDNVAHTLALDPDEPADDDSYDDDDDDDDEDLDEDLDAQDEE